MTEAIVDACCFINLYATGDLRGFLEKSDWSWHIPSAVLAESLYIRGTDDRGEAERKCVETKGHIDEGLISLAEVTGTEEAELYVQLASDLDDGEAMALAIAKRRGWTLATDDRKARRFAGQLDVPVVTTPELMQHWAKKGKMSASRIKVALRNIETGACFVPADNMPGYDWWIAQLCEEPSP